MAPCASINRLFHLGHGVAASDDDTFQGNQLVDLERIELTNLVFLLHVEGPYLDDCIVLILLHKASLIRLHKYLLLVDLQCNQIEDRDHVCGIIF